MVSSSFGRTGSSGSLSKLKEKLIESITYFDVENYSDFLLLYKNNYKKKVVESLR